MASTVVTALTVSGIRIARLQTQPLGFRNSLKDRGWVYLSHIYRIWLRFSVFIGLIVYNSVLIREVILFCKYNIYVIFRKDLECWTLLGENNKKPDN